MKNLLRILFLLLSIAQIFAIAWYFYLGLPTWVILGQGVLALIYHIIMLFSISGAWVRGGTFFNISYMVFTFANVALDGMNINREIYLIAMFSIVIFIWTIEVFDLTSEEEKEKSEEVEKKEELELPDLDASPEPQYRDEDLV